MSEDTERKRFSQKLTDLVSEFRHVPPEQRSFDLFMSFVALLEISKGKPVTVTDVAKCASVVAKRLVSAGFVVDDSPRKDP